MLSLPPRPGPDGLPSSPRARKTVHTVPPNAPLGPASKLCPHPQMSLRPRHRQPPRITRTAASSNRTHYDARQNDSSGTREDVQIRTSFNPPARARNEKCSWTQAQPSHGSVPSPLPKNDQSAPAAFRGRPGDGYTVWGAVTNAASVLTINVSKAWNTQNKIDSGEDTPPGQESRLTRAMKAHHIAKAQNPSDLPDWLFNKRERSVANEPRQLDPNTHQIDSSPPRMRGESNVSSSEHPASATLASLQRPPLRGVDRLKAMRSTTRGSTTRYHNNDDSRSDDWHPLNLGDTRIGLPFHPPRGRR